jgi:hypothetical protein
MACEKVIFDSCRSATVNTGFTCKYNYGGLHMACGKILFDGPEHAGLYIALACG